MSRIQTIVSCLFIAVLMFLPEALIACEKCFGGSAANTPTVRGIGLAMLGLLLLTLIVLGGITTFFIYMNRRARLIASGEYAVTEKGILLSLPRRIIEKS